MKNTDNETPSSQVYHLTLVIGSQYVQHLLKLFILNYSNNKPKKSDMQIYSDQIHRSVESSMLKCRT